MLTRALNRLNHIRIQLKYIIKKGDKFHCPFCEYKSRVLALIGENVPVFKELEIIGGGLRKAACIKCYSTDRERLIFSYLFHEIGLDELERFKILHIAPERRISEKILALGPTAYRCGDLFTSGYRYPDYVENMDVTRLSDADNTYDLVLCNHVLEHVPDDSAAMNEIYRVLKPGGRAVLLVPFANRLTTTLEDPNISSPEDRYKYYGQADHVRLYGVDYFNRLESAGFAVNRYSLHKKYPKMGLNPLEDLIVGKK